MEEEDALIPVCPYQEEVLHYLDCLFQAHLDSEEEVLEYLFLADLGQGLCQVVLSQALCQVVQVLCQVDL